MLMEFPPRWWPALAAHWLFYQRSQWWPRARLEAYADERLRRLVRHAARHVPYYRALFRQLGLAPEAFRGRVDLPRLPLLDKETVRRRGDELVAENAAAFQPAWSRTSGSTGTPLRFALSGAARRHNAAVTLRSYGWAGFWPGRRVFTLKWFMRGWLYRYGLAGRTLNADTMQLGVATAPALWREINRLRPAVFHGYPMALLLLAKLARDAGLAYHRPRILLTIGETLSPAIRRALREAYAGAAVCDYYGMTEQAVLITECRCGSAHVLDDYAWHEFVDEAGAPVAAGRGEIVGTNYHNYAMPLLRYRTRDFAQLPAAPTPCACGRAFRTVTAIEGRAEDFVQTPDGKFLSLFEEPLNEGRGIMAAQYVQEAPGELYVNILPGPDFDPASLPAVERALRQRVGPAMRLSFRVVAELERRAGEGGKTPFVISRIGHQRPRDP